MVWANRTEMRKGKARVNGEEEPRERRGGEGGGNKERVRVRVRNKGRHLGRRRCRPHLDERRERGRAAWDPARKVGAETERVGTAEAPALGLLGVLGRVLGVLGLPGWAGVDASLGAADWADEGCVGGRESVWCLSLCLSVWVSECVRASVCLSVCVRVPLACGCSLLPGAASHGVPFRAVSNRGQRAGG
jgi:hypothetical protein